MTPHHIDTSFVSDLSVGRVQSEEARPMTTRLPVQIALAAAMLILAGCHTTQFGQSIGFPSPAERARSASFAP